MRTFTIMLLALTASLNAGEVIGHIGLSRVLNFKKGAYTEASGRLIFAGKIVGFGILAGVGKRDTIYKDYIKKTKAIEIGKEKMSEVIIGKVTLAISVLSTRKNIVSSYGIRMKTRKVELERKYAGSTYLEPLVRPYIGIGTIPRMYSTTARNMRPISLSIGYSLDQFYISIHGGFGYRVMMD